MEIQNSYLMWVGSGDYEDIKAYTDEVVSMGVSKRIPGIGMANALSEPNTVVFVAHDEGEFDPCDYCMGIIDCPDCRVREGKIDRWNAEADKVLDRYKSEDDIPPGKARIVRIRREKMAAAEQEIAKCESCDGEKEYEDGTGGHVILTKRNDFIGKKKRIDYRSFNYWMRQPEKFDHESEVSDYDMCEECGGNGKLPRARIFGVFVPSGIEYILNGKENEIVKEHIADFAQLDMVEIRKEPKRKCGKRIPGYYVVTRKGKKPMKAAKEVVKELIAKGVIKKGDVDVTGDFIRFAKPVEYPGLRRFRGVKSFNLIPEAEDQAEMALDAVE